MHVVRKPTFNCLTALARAAGLFLLLLLVAARALAAGVGLAWDPVTSASGYVVYYGPAAGNYPSRIDVGNTNTYTVTSLVEGATYHFAVTAYDGSHAESGFSNDVAGTVPYSAPVAQFTASATLGVAPLALNFLNASTGTITSYAWTFGDGTTSTVANPSKVYSAAGTYTVSLTVTGPGGSNTQTRTNYITVTALPPAPVAQFTGTPTSGVTPLTVNFTNTSTGSITSYAWTFGDGSTSTVANPSKVYSVAGTYTVSLTVTGPGGSNTQTRTNYITVAALPPAPVAQFTGTPTSGVTPLTVNFTNTSTGSITSHAWTFGDGTTSTVANPSKVYSVAGTYTVSLTVAGPGGSNTQTRTNYITVTGLPPRVGTDRQHQSLPRELKRPGFDLEPMQVPSEGSGVRKWK
jgi:PKD repeat protein